jgi:hypothetical protein
MDDRFIGRIFLLLSMPPMAWGRKKKFIIVSNFLDTEFQQNYTSLSCNFAVAASMSYR